MERSESEIRQRPTNAKKETPITVFRSMGLQSRTAKRRDSRVWAQGQKICWVGRSVPDRLTCSVAHRIRNGLEGASTGFAPGTVVQYGMVLPEASQDSHLIEILCTLHDRGIDFVVAGGVAAVLHGVERMTLDLDVAVSLDPDNLKSFLSALDQLRLVPRAPIPPDTILDAARVEELVREKNALVFTFWNPQEPYRQIDMFLTRENSFDDLVADAHALTIRGRTIRVASRRKLIEMKSRVRPIREKDLGDIEALTKIDQNNPTPDGKPLGE